MSFIELYEIFLNTWNIFCDGSRRLNSYLFKVFNQWLYLFIRWVYLLSICRKLFFKGWPLPSSYVYLIMNCMMFIVWMSMLAFSDALDAVLILFLEHGAVFILADVINLFKNIIIFAAWTSLCSAFSIPSLKLLCLRQLRFILLHLFYFKL